MLAETNGKPHVLFISYHLPKGEEPGAFRPWMECRLLQMAGFRVTVITSGVQYMTGQDIRSGRGWCTEEFCDGIRIFRVWAPKEFRRSLSRRILNYLSYAVLAGLAAFCKAGRVDRVFSCTDPITLMPMVFLVSQLKRAPMILDERDLFPETAVALGVMKEGWLSRFLFGLQQFFRRRAVGILAATPGIRTCLLAYGCPPEKVQLLYNADVFLDEELAQAGCSLRLQENSGPTFWIAYAGGLGYANDVGTILKAALRLREKEDVGFLILGDGEQRPAYEDFCRRHNLSSVRFLGALPRQRARQVLREVHICLQPLQAPEHFNHTLTSKTFDYHGLGKPMIFCGRGDTRKLLAESGGGLAVPPGDDQSLAAAILRLRDDQELREQMGTAARKWFENNVSVATAGETIKKLMKTEEFHISLELRSY